jgi:gamma-glutamyltranspeptidase
MTVPFSWTEPYASPRTPVLARNVVCTSQPLAAQAGLEMLTEGGTRSAALVAAITLTLVEPVSNGIGSDAFAIVWDGRQLHGLNASGRSPAAWTPEYFHGRPVPARGWNSVTVPGALSAWVELHAKFGSCQAICGSMTVTSRPAIRAATARPQAADEGRRSDCQTWRHEGFVGSTSRRSTGPSPKMAITAGSRPSGNTPS